MDLKKLSLGQRIMSIAGVLLLLDVLILPWHRISIGAGVFGINVNRTGVQSPNGFFGLLIALVALAVVVRIGLSEFTSVELPALPVTWERADLIAGAAAAALVLLKLVLETSYLSIGAWLAVPLAGALAYGGYVRSQESARPADASPADSSEPHQVT
ncbi:MAG: hypothetical protein QOE80_3021 [Actinomycetota bacterium]|jgi:hypothetical protein|nr:hypothetical protein [Actinomycetota bacterium]